MGEASETEVVSDPTTKIRRLYSKAERLERASLRVAMHIRGLWEEKGSSDTRLLEGLLLPDDLTVVGHSVAIAGVFGKVRREHVVPRRVIIKKCHEMLAAERDDQSIAEVIRDYTKIVLISEEECERLDKVVHLGLRQTMPQDWKFGDDPFARLKAAGISWVSLADLDVEALAASDEATPEGLSGLDGSATLGVGSHPLAPT